MIIVDVRNVTKTYKNNTSKTVALDNCDFKAEKEKFTCILGKSGCGKSTLLNVIGGLQNVDRGEIYVNDTNLCELKKKELLSFRRKNIGFIFQFFNLLQEQTVFENIIIPFDLNNEKYNINFVNEIMSFLGLNQIRNKFPNELSGGEQQRVAIARALVRKPLIILADEPTGNLDKYNSKKVISLLKEFQMKYSLTVIMVTHDIEISKHGDAIAYMEDGKIVQYETT